MRLSSVTSLRTKRRSAAGLVTVDAWTASPLRDDRALRLVEVVPVAVVAITVWERFGA
jgi:hypothetical protein